MKKELSARKKKILKAVVEEYIESASPVSSGGIKAKHFDDISSATIRSELSTLEDMGYLIQPHTSAGRVPSREAYQLYVTEVLEANPLSKAEISLINSSFEERFTEVEDIVKRTAKVISDVTNYTSVIVLKNISEVTIREIKLVSLDEHSALLIIITDSGIIRDKVIVVEKPLTDGGVKDANSLINKMFGGKTVYEIKHPDEIVAQELEQIKELYQNLVRILDTYSEGADDVVVEGASKMLEHQGGTIDSARNFLSLIETRGMLTEIIDDDNDIEISVKVGKDENGGIENCAIVTARYKIGGKEIGHAGVIGPERMDYAKVLSVLKYIGQGLDGIQGNNGGSNGEE